MNSSTAANTSNTAPSLDDLFAGQIIPRITKGEHRCRIEDVAPRRRTDGTTDIVLTVTLDDETFTRQHAVKITATSELGVYNPAEMLAQSIATRFYPTYLGKPGGILRQAATDKLVIPVYIDPDAVSNSGNAFTMWMFNPRRFPDAQKAEAESLAEDLDALV